MTAGKHIADRKSRVLRRAYDLDNAHKQDKLNYKRENAYKGIILFLFVKLQRFGVNKVFVAVAAVFYVVYLRGKLYQLDAVFMYYYAEGEEYYLCQQCKQYQRRQIIAVDGINQTEQPPQKF